MALRPRGPRSGPGCSVPIRHHLIGLIRPARRLDERIDSLPTNITTLVEQDPAWERLLTVPGIGAIISSAAVAAIGNGDVFSKGRDFAAWLGLVPGRSRSETEPSSGKYQSAAIGTCGSCSCGRLGWY